MEHEKKIEFLWQQCNLIAFSPFSRRRTDWENINGMIKMPPREVECVMKNTRIGNT
jgi:hypothetical protein